MLRFTVAAIVVAISLHSWGEISSRLLPWPTVTSRRVVPVPLEPEPHGRVLSEAVPVLQSTVPVGSAFAPSPADSENLLASNSQDWPLHAFQRTPHGPPTHQAASTHFGLNIVLGLVAVLLVAAVFREQQAGLRRLCILVLGALFLVLMTDVSHGVWMEWPQSYTAVLAIDHGVGTLLAGLTAAGVLWIWKAPAAGRRVPAAESTASGCTPAASVK
jgi:hypothetical protein